MKPGSTLLFPFCAIILLALPAFSQASEQLDIPAPSGSEKFGQTVTVLPNGNIVITDPLFDLPGPVANVGAVYLYSPDGALISQLRGSTANDRVGESGIQVLASGNFVVRSSLWNGNRGAVTWGSASTGFGATTVTVSALNSLVGSTTGDGVGSTNIVTLVNGHYVVISQTWNNLPKTSVGAVTWGNGYVGTSGAISSSNSLIGSTTNDQVGSGGIRALTNGHYVIASPSWDGSFTNTGAVTWANGNGGTIGEISALNSLVGSFAGSLIGSTPTVALTNGNYVVVSPFWNGVRGAVTWGNGQAGTVGIVSAANSLVGTNTNDAVGNSGVCPLVNGHYVVCSSLWDNGSFTNAGAATWCNGNGGTVGDVSPANSLVGGAIGDQVGNLGCTALTNGHYVVNSGNWRGNRGAVTWGNGNTGTTGEVSETNSMTGSQFGDNVGFYGATALTNGNYVVASPSWDNGPVTDVGAATWGDGSRGTRGAVSAANSLIGSQTGDQVGYGGVYPLTNGNYVVSSAFWDNAAIANVGAVTWGDGRRGTRGVVSAANSLVGSKMNDSVGSYFIVPLSNGHFVAGSPNWDNGSAVNAGAATWCNGNGGTVGPVTPSNSIVGSHTGDSVGQYCIPLVNSHYVLINTSWSNDATPSVGAITWGNGSGGSQGVISVENSLIGETANDSLGQGAFQPLEDGNYAILSPDWDNGIVMNGGAATLGAGTSGLCGYITIANSVIGYAPGSGSSFTYGYDAKRQQLIVGRPAEGMVSILRATRTISLAKSGTSAPGAADISHTTPLAAAVNQQGNVLLETRLNGSGSTGGRNRATFSGKSATDMDLLLQTGTPLQSLGYGLSSAQSARSFSHHVFHQDSRGLFVSTLNGTGINASNNQLLLLDNGNNLFALMRTGWPLTTGSLSGNSLRSISQVLQSPFQDHIILPYTLNLGGTVNTGNDSGILLLTHSGGIQPNLDAREGASAFGGGGLFGSFTPMATTAVSDMLYFIAQFRPTSGTPKAASFYMTADGTTKLRSVAPGDTAGGSSGATFRSFSGLTHVGTFGLLRSTLNGSPAATNEGIWLLPLNGLLLRKGTPFTPVGYTQPRTIRRFLGIWPVHFSGQIIVLAQLDGSPSNQALLLLQNDSTIRILAETGYKLHGMNQRETLRSIQAVDISPLTGSYTLLGSIAGAPASRNQALWVGHTYLGLDASTFSERLPRLSRRKGELYRTGSTPSGQIRSIAIRPVRNSSGANSRGHAHIVSGAGHVVAEITGDGRRTEVVLIEP